MLAMIALIAGSANAAWMSAARCAGEACAARVLGYSTGRRPNSSRSRVRPSS
jgi:hypothetical protein